MNGAGPLFRKGVADSNAPCQEKALDALIAYLRAVDTDASRHVFEALFVGNSFQVRTCLQIFVNRFVTCTASSHQFDLGIYRLSCRRKVICHG